ncbi:EAL domain-containing protein [Vibrio sinaloensis]|nr:EAL domain-containing protein [Vibrio sinaloensis]
MSINVSVQQLMDSQIKQALRKELTLNDMSPKDVILEITESVFIEDMQQVNAMCNELVEEGFRLSLDDFGTGYSSLSSLSQLPLSELKIDKSFIDGLPDDSSSERMVNNIIDIARNHKMTVVAEGIETQAQKKQKN